MILLELVPRHLTTLVAETKSILAKYPQIEAINIPDILRVPIRSYTAAKLLLAAGIRTIPHFRAIDRPIAELCQIISELEELGLREVLIIRGDKPQTPGVQTYALSPLDVVKVLQEKHPRLKIYCGLDPYRTSFRTELEYCQAKSMAGAHGFFSQPFFDLELARIYLEQLTDTQLFIGHAPVISNNSRGYWEAKNNAIFPANFQLDLAYNCSTAQQLIKLAKTNNQHAYLMPITASTDDYLRGVFSQEP